LPRDLWIAPSSKAVKSALQLINTNTYEVLGDEKPEDRYIKALKSVLTVKIEDKWQAKKPIGLIVAVKTFRNDRPLEGFEKDVQHLCHLFIHGTPGNQSPSSF
jgi:hypothetical protein